MTNVIHLPPRKPTPEQLELPRAQVSGILHDLNVTTMELQGRLMGARTADEFAHALKQIHGELTVAADGFSALVETTRNWR